MNRLDGKRALITGGTSGIGLEAARQFLAEGARVAVTGASPAGIEATRAELGDGVTVIRADAGDVAGQRPIAEAVDRALGGLDVLFVNAGVGDFRGDFIVSKPKHIPSYRGILGRPLFLF